MAKVFRLGLAGYEFNYSFMDQLTPHFFKDYILSESPAVFDLETTPEDMHRWSGIVLPGQPDSFLEQRLMILKISAYLCKKYACVMHACAVKWHGYAWLFTAPSGVGKTTMFRNWRTLYGQEVEILNGDMPFVARCNDGHIHVYPSPWNGKENYGSQIDAPLGGILFLKQGDSNFMYRAGAGDVVAALYSQFMCPSDSEEIIRCLSALEESILTSVPVWIYTNTGDLQSAIVSTDVILQDLEKNE